MLALWDQPAVADARAGEQCPPDDVLYALAAATSDRPEVARNLSEHERELACAHLATCALCTELLGSTVRSLRRVAEANAPQSADRGDADFGPTAALAVTELATPAASDLDQNPSRKLGPGFAVGALVASRYRVVEMLGEGGMAVVLGTIDEAPAAGGARIALKILYGEAAESTAIQRRLLREARIVSTLQSVHITKLWQVGFLDDGAPYLAMEWLEGCDLRRAIHEKGKLPEPRALRIAHGICCALEVAHTHGIVHRDIKPGNVFLIRDASGEECAKLLDFGISKWTEDGSLAQSQQSGDATLTRASSFLGTPAYMAPEQVHDARTANHASDLWAVGVVLYEMLTGNSPFSRATFGGTLAAVLTELPDLSVLPAASRAVVAACLARSPSERVQSATDLNALLHAAIAGQKTDTSGVQVVAANARSAATYSTIKIRTRVLAGAFVVGIAALYASRQLASSTPTTSNTNSAAVAVESGEASFAAPGPAPSEARTSAPGTGAAASSALSPSSPPNVNSQLARVTSARQAAGATLPMQTATQTTVAQSALSAFAAPTAPAVALPVATAVAAGANPTPATSTSPTSNRAALFGERL
jgi:eukaryotic-like serine/threonine-protein kinase